MGWVVSGGFLLECVTRMKRPGIVVLFEKEALLWTE